MADKVQVASLFTGAGGLDIGFNKLSEYKIISHLDFDEDAIQTLEANANQTEYIGKDAEIIPQDIREYKGDGIPASEVDLVIGGPPCQPFSAAARRTGGIEGVDDEDGKLFLAYVRLLERWQPRGFLLENVYGITSDEKGWAMIAEAFNDAGYEVTHRTLDAADYGVPQHRERTFIVGTREDLTIDYQFPRPTHGPDSHTGKDLITAGEALEGLNQKAVAAKGPYEITSKHAHLLDDIPPGLNYSFYTEKLGHPKPVFGWRSRFSDYLYKADPEAPVRTLKAQPGAASGPFHWENRKFTEAELKRLQTFPDRYILEGSYSKVVKQIGNSVPPRLAEVLAKSIADQLFDVGEYDVKTMPDSFDLTYRSQKRTSTEEYQRKARERLKELGLWEKNVHREGSQRALTDYPGDESSESGSRSEIKQEMWRFSSFFQYGRSELDGDSDIAGCERAFVVESFIQDGVLEVQIERYDGATGGLSISLDPQDGVWNGIHNLRVEAQEVALDDIFYIWYIVGTDVTKRTRYEKFMDVVGHYSTTRLDYTSSLKLEGFEQSPLTKALTHFSQASNCNTVVTLEELASQLGESQADVLGALRELRSWRYEIRTSATRATMPEGEILCAYPFPDLNERSHFEGDVELESLLQSEN